MLANPNNSKYNFLLENNQKYMNFTALTFDKQKITYEQLHDRIEKYVRILYKKGIRENDRIGVCALNTPESVYLLYALDIIGAVVIGYSPLDNKEKIKKVDVSYYTEQDKIALKKGLINSEKAKALRLKKM